MTLTADPVTQAFASLDSALAARRAEADELLADDARRAALARLDAAKDLHRRLLADGIGEDDEKRIPLMLQTLRLAREDFDADLRTLARIRELDSTVIPGTDADEQAAHEAKNEAAEEYPQVAREALHALVDRIPPHRAVGMHALIVEMRRVDPDHIDNFLRSLTGAWMNPEPPYDPADYTGVSEVRAIERRMQSATASASRAVDLRERAILERQRLISSNPRVAAVL